MIKRDLYFKKNDGKTIFARLYLPGTGRAYPVTIFAHGFGSDFSNLEHYGPMFVEHDIGMLFFDFCGGGPRSRSDGSMLEMSVLTELDDLLFVIEELCRLGSIDTDNIFLMGESQGGYVAALGAATIPDKIKGLILWYPAFVLEENAAAAFEDGNAVGSRLFGLDVGAIYNKDAVSVKIYDRIGRYEKDVLILHGNQDYVVPVDASRRALAIYKSAELHIFDGAGHGFVGEDIDRAARDCIEYVKRHTA